jgi:subtilisin family serine protease
MSGDDDDDGDGVTDRSDPFPLDKSETLDTDGDGIGNNTDTDDDGDGVADGSDACPLDSRETLDTDSDGICNNTDDDDDGDGVADGSDAFPLDKTETLDTDRDGIGNNEDTDDDNDGVADGSDDYPLDSERHKAPTTASQSLSLNLLPKTTNVKTGTLTSTSQSGTRVTYTIVSNGSLGTATLTDSAGAFSYSTTSAAVGNDSFTYKINDGKYDSTASTISIGIKTDPLYKYQWHLNNTGQKNFTNNSGTTGADLNVDTVIAPSDSRIASVTGQGVTIAIVDSGMEITHEDLVDNVVANGSWNFSNSSNDPTPSSSGVDHGTMVASIAAAAGWNDKGIRGVAPDASLKAFNLLADYDDTNEINALGALSLASDVSVFNMSYGSGTFGTALLPLPSDAKFAQIATGATSLRSNKGASYVNSVGNDYYTGATGTSNFSYCGNGANAGTLKISCYDTIFDRVFYSAYLIGVAALNADGVKASYSTAGSTTWVSAYGGETGGHTDYSFSGRPSTDPAITAADRSSCAKGANSSVSNEGINNGVRANAFNDYQSPHSENPSCNYTNIMNGTSSAAPMVSGVIALMLEANSALTARDVKHILATTATQVDSSFSATAVNSINYVGWVTNKGTPALKFHPWYGFGAINADAAVSAARGYRAGSLGTLAFSAWNNSNVRAGAAIPEGELKTFELDEDTRDKKIEHINIALKIDHAAPNHLGFRLESPSGTISTLLPPLTALSTALSSSNWVYLPTNAFYGEDTAGTWKLHIYDHFAGTSGTLVQWGMQFGYH